MIIETRTGYRFRTRPGTNDENVVRACVDSDEYELGPLDVRGKLIFDVGAHIGGVGVWLAARGATAVCVEPVPANAALIAENALLNGASARVTVVQEALGEPGQAYVNFEFDYDENARHHAWIGNVGAPREHCRSLHVLTRTLTDLVRDFGRPDVLKLDCEGGEWTALCEVMTTREIPLIVGEWHPIDGHVRAEVAFLLGESHDVTFTGPAAGPGGFRAVLR